MFTGIVQAVGVVAQVLPTREGRRVEIDPLGWAHGATAGDSVCVHGVCLTVAAPPGGAGGRLIFDAVPETLARTEIGSWRAGTRVNLEASLTATTGIGGHFVQGHVDGVGTVAGVSTGGEHRLTIRLPEPAQTGGFDLRPCLVPKGSVAVDGVSLTVAGVAADGTFDVALIPTTLARTTLGQLREGSRCHIECDIIAKTIVRCLALMNLRPGAGA